MPAPDTSVSQALLHLLAHLCALTGHHSGCVHLRYCACGLLAARDSGLGESSNNSCTQITGFQALWEMKPSRFDLISLPTFQVLRKRGVYENVKYVQQENFWIGPSSVRTGLEVELGVVPSVPGPEVTAAVSPFTGGPHSPGGQVFTLHAPGPTGAQLHPCCPGA